MPKAIKQPTLKRKFSKIKKKAQAATKYVIKVSGFTAHCQALKFTPNKTTLRHALNTICYHWGADVNEMKFEGMDKVLVEENNNDSFVLTSIK